MLGSRMWAGTCLLGALVAFVVGNYLPTWVGANDAAYILSLVLTFIIASALAGVGAVVLWRKAVLLRGTCSPPSSPTG